MWGPIKQKLGVKPTTTAKQEEAEGMEIFGIAKEVDTRGMTKETQVPPLFS